MKGTPVHIISHIIPNRISLPVALIFLKDDRERNVVVTVGGISLKIADDD